MSAWQSQRDLAHPGALCFPCSRFHCRSHVGLKSFPRNLACQPALSPSFSPFMKSSLCGGPRSGVHVHVSGEHQVDGAARAWYPQMNVISGVLNDHRAPLCEITSFLGSLSYPHVPTSHLPLSSRPCLPTSHSQLAMLPAPLGRKRADEIKDLTSQPPNLPHWELPSFLDPEATTMPLWDTGYIFFMTSQTFPSLALFPEQLSMLHRSRPQSWSELRHTLEY